MKFTCYHGTKFNYADSIIRTKSFTPSGTERDWLGKGCYFYVDCRNSAFNFCKTVKRFSDDEIVVIEAVISSENYYDLTNESTYDAYQEILKRLRERVLRSKEAKTYPRILDGHCIDIINKTMNYDHILVKFRLGEKYKEGYSRIINPKLLNDNTFNRVVCVKNTSCIETSSIKEA